MQIRNWDVSASRAEPRALSDFLVWRDALRSVTDLGAYRNVTSNLIVGTNAGRPVRAAEITASAFRIAPEPPLLGRVLARADERPGAPPVVVVGYDVWRTRFGSDVGVVGRTVQLGDAYATVVGVMPEGFAFPVSHELWTPLRLDVLDPAPREGPGITVFGRLADGVTLEEAQAELTALGRRAAAELPNTHEHLLPRVAPYAQVLWEPSGADLAFLLSIYVFPVMLLVLVCGNVALLLFARAATRESELVVRSALGASRSRISMQLFAEALVLGGVAAALGLGAAQFGLRRWGAEFLERNEGQLPFWFDLNLSGATVLYVIGLTVLGAVITGVLPALKATRGLGSRLKQGTAGGGALQFGGVWTAVIVVQVAVTVAFPAVVYVEQRELARLRSYDAGFAAEEYLAVRLDMDAPAGSDADSAVAAARRERFAAAVEALRQRVAGEPGVAGVTFVDRLPRDYHSERRIELDEEAGVAGQAGATTTAASPAAEATMASIDPSYFEVLRSPVLAGRGFTAADLASDARAVIVDQGFVELIMGGRNPVGRRVRFTGDKPESGAEHSPPWYEIVGVVRELGMAPFNTGRRAAGLYLPASPGSADPLHMLVHARGEPMSLAPRVREIAAAVDPTMQLSDLQRVDEVTNDVVWVLGLWMRMTVAVTAIALLLSLAGIYAVMSFAVARRTREIGIRVALGAARWRIVAAVFRRPLSQVGLGVVAGTLFLGLATLVLSAHRPDGRPWVWVGPSLEQVALLVVHTALMLGVCTLACIVPTRRALRVKPTEALRADG